MILNNAINFFSNMTDEEFFKFLEECNINYTKEDNNKEDDKI